MVSLRVYSTAVWVVVLSLANGVTAQDERPGGELRTRVGDAFAFCDKFLDRQVSTVTELAYYPGLRCYQRRSTDGASPSRDGAFLGRGCLRRDRQVLWLEELEPFPASDDSALVKLVATPERECNINYVGPDTESGISGSQFMEGPHEQGTLPSRASIVGEGVWYGYLLANELPEISTLVSETDWAPSADGKLLSARYDQWMIDVKFDGSRDRPQEIAVRRTRQRRPDDPKHTVYARAIEFLEWETIEGVDCPKRVVTWELFLNGKRELTTAKSEVTLESVGPVPEISDRYGDFLTGVPNGTRVQVNDYLGIDFIWQDGEIVRKVDGVKLASLLGQSFFGSPLRRYVLFSIGLLTLAIITWLVWRRTSQQSLSASGRGSRR